MISTPHAGARPPDVDGAREWMSICYRSARPPGGTIAAVHFAGSRQVPLAAHHQATLILWPRVGAMAQVGPKLPKLVLQQVGRYLGYSGREANPFGEGSS
jgi:hypothetical protein